MSIGFLLCSGSLYCYRVIVCVSEKLLVHFLRRIPLDNLFRLVRVRDFGGKFLIVLSTHADPSVWLLTYHHCSSMNPQNLNHLAP
jgi:hypothetical protein